MTFSRLVAALTALVTAMLLQATVIGPLVMPLPVSLPLIVILAVAVLQGPSTGITFGFAGGLLVDLSSNHPVGVLALTWLLAGLAAGVLGGMVTAVTGAGRRAPSAIRVQRSHRTRRRPQALLVGLIGAVTAAVTAIMLTVIGSGTDPLLRQLVRAVPAGALEAIIALLVVPMISFALGTVALRPRPSANPATSSRSDVLVSGW
jgi:hypothetical protein